jgi:hypothetical protein
MRAALRHSKLSGMSYHDMSAASTPLCPVQVMPE